MALWRPSYEGERPTLGWEALAWFEEYLIVPDGPAAGEPLVLTREQAMFVLKLYEVKPDFVGPAVPEGARAMVSGRLVRRAVLSRPKGWGKALALDTRLATPTGWTTMGEVSVGDELVDENGLPTTVTAATAVMQGRPCFEVTFSDGTRIVADAEHLWPMEEFNGGGRTRKLVTTQQIHDKGVTYPRKLPANSKAVKPGVSRWKTLGTPQIAGQAEWASVIPPYVLGMWLGDGDSDCSRLTVGDEDASEVAAILTQLGVSMEPRGGYRYLLGRGWMHSELRRLGLLNNKHIPSWVMRCPSADRMEVLRGLMDSDGTVNKDGDKTEFCSTKPVLAHGFMELAKSLGFTPRMRESDARLKGVTVGRRFRINMTAYSDDPVFRLPRKVARLKRRPQSKPFSACRTVTSVIPVESVPVRCVSVSGPSSLYLAGDGLVPTHNSPMVAALCMFEALGPAVMDGWDADGQPVGREWNSLGFKPKVQVVAVTESQTVNTWDPLLTMAREGPVYDYYDIEPMETMVNVPRGLIEFTTSSGTAREGFRPVFVAADQTESWVQTNGGLKLHAAMQRNLAKVQGCMVETPNAFIPGQQSVAERSFKAYGMQEGQTERVKIKGILVDHQAAPADIDVHDDEELRNGLKAAYGDSLDLNGGWVAVDRIIDEFWDPDTSLQDARAYYLNQITHAETSYLPPAAWERCVDETKALKPGDMITLGFDGSRGRKSRGKPDATALVACRVSDGHLVNVRIWEASDDELTWPAWEINAATVTRALEKVFQTYRVAAFYADPGPGFASELKEWEGRWGTKVKVKAGGNSAFWWSMNKTGLWQIALETFEEDVKNEQLTHSGSEPLTRHIMNAHRQIRGGKLTIAKADDYSPHKMDGAVAAVLAYQAKLDVRGRGVKSNRGSVKRVR